MILHCSVGADPFAVRAALQSLIAAPPMATLAAEHRNTAEIVLAEVLNNVAEHAYAGRTGDLSVTVRLTSAGLACKVIDRGAAMPAGRLPPGRLQDATNLSLQDLPEGGFGWHLIRALTSDLSYAREDGQNRLCFLIPG